jgi:hypothetical protein
MEPFGQMLEGVKETDPHLEELMRGIQLFDNSGIRERWRCGFEEGGLEEMLD